MCDRGRSTGGVIPSVNRALLALADRVGVDPALLGDVVEDWRAGRSASWLARQLLAAVALTIRAQAIVAPSRLFVPIYVGTVVACVLRVVTLPIAPMAARHFGSAVGNSLLIWKLDVLRVAFFRYQLYDLPRVVITCVVYAAAGYAVRRAARQSPGSIIVYWFLVQVFWGVGLVGLWPEAALTPKSALYTYSTLYSFVCLPIAILLPGLRRSQQHVGSARGE